ncbi:SanA/YdcF family protein [Dermatophilus congolensis]|uniref:SanA/YdcF family protein n=1 Tax=Dermatophilus congolensis TaxID=1863 RepID=UPI001AAED9FD|nr:YdcF family protein [Dermatophilus congolensis]MBO3143981.1 YdcF family protein [Dermatophilus congolensis]MBO3152971.1 YdcF family protein [Dermatophilus congolensis]MBO3160017.1 YdcF family protein [Dermatophilus congolensis]MBO3164259.1 YdcF family protein [Dermatophilus congolensis]MBO3177803.1 YdcF family protein [Dermatophilus congolensis]
MKNTALPKPLIYTLLTTGVTLGSISLAMAGSSLWIYRASQWRVFSAQQLGITTDRTTNEDLHPATVMVLGAQAYPEGRPSPFLAARLDVALQLWNANLAKRILVTGDGNSGGLGETTTMANYLREHGIPADKIDHDPIGINTYASMRNAAEAGITQMYVVSQRFHLPRAVALARAVGIDAIGIADDTTNTSSEWAEGEIRELFAGIKAATRTLSDLTVGQIHRR